MRIFLAKARVSIRAVPIPFALALPLCALPTSGSAAVTGNAFNPAISLIVAGNYAHYSQDPAKYGMPGFLLGDEAGLLPRGFSLGETELTASSNVDNYFYGQVTLSLAALDSSTEVNLEEAFLQTTALPDGFTLKFGRLYSDIGYLNAKHSHTWDFVDQPLAYKAMLGGQYGDDGVQLRWVAPTDLLVEMGAEAFRGAQFPAAGATHGGVGSYTAFAHLGGDVGSESSWRAGVSYLRSDALQRESTLSSGAPIAFSGQSRLWIADAIWKWADHGNPKTRNFVVQGEYLRRREHGTVVDTATDYGLLSFTPDFNYSGTQSGFYLQGVYQFMPRWRVGLRYDRLQVGNRGPDLAIDTPLVDPHDPERLTAMLDFSNSEFSRFRVQVARDKSQPVGDTQLMFQYVMSIGAHGAHQF